MTDDEAWEMGRAANNEEPTTYFCGKDIREMSNQELRLALVHMAKLHSDAVARNQRNIQAFIREPYSGSYGGHGFS